MNPNLIEQRGLLNFRFLTVLGVIIIFTLTVGYFFYGLEPSFKREGSIQFQIKKGDSFKTIGVELSNESLLRSISVFKVYALFGGYAQKFQPGFYELSSAMSVPEIVQTITLGGKDEITVTIPEGSTLKDAEYILSNADVIASGSLEKVSIERFSPQYPFLSGRSSLEGFIFPDTYRFKIQSSADVVLKKFLDTWNLKAYALLENSKNWYETIILASILEREVPEFEDRQVVAGILLKRVRNKIPLQVDSTIIYAKCDAAIKECKNPKINREDLSTVSSYNTYQHLGWPPGPISNPGEAAIRAALTPKSSPYFYYLSSKKTGITIFSRNLEEHNINREKYL